MTSGWMVMRFEGLVFFFILAVLFIKTVGSSDIFISKVHKGKGYVVRIPEGWIKKKEEKGVKYPAGIQVVTFLPEDDQGLSGEPDAYISIFTKKLSAPVWIEDEFPEILKSLREAGYTIKDKGEIKLDELLSNWTVYYDKETPALVLEFYMVTDNSVFYKIQYSAHPDKFRTYRKAFESLKDSFKFRFSLY